MSGKLTNLEEFFVALRSQRDNLAVDARGQIRGFVGYSDYPCCPILVLGWAIDNAILRHQANSDYPFVADMLGLPRRTAELIVSAADHDWAEGVGEGSLRRKMLQVLGLRPILKVGARA